ncbi:hypothetical protein BJ138DRAFT_986573, partial [Hygrophoropsis aurantiaca]
MIGCNFLLQISEALNDATGLGTSFGGISVVFAGDFAQLPPVGQSRLYAHLDVQRLKRNKWGQNAMLGKLLWLSVTTVVLLTEVMRQAGPENVPFVQLLQRLRHGKCTAADFELLNTRLVSRVRPNWTSPGWLDAPVIVSDNDVKDKINERAAIEFAHRVGRPLHWYYCTD